MFKRRFILIVMGTFVFNLLLSFFVFSLFLPRIDKTPAEIPRPEPENPDKNYTTIIIGGDVMLGRTVNRKGVESKDFGYPFNNIGNILSASDLVFVNLESPFATGCPVITGGFTFCSDPKMVEALRVGSVDVVSLSNNHIRNFGSMGIDDTKKILAENSIAYTGLGDLTVKEVNGIKFGFLGFDFTVLDITDEDIKFIQASDQKVDVLMIGVHWGDEYKAIHNEKQERIAKLIVENGGDVIAGHHPHWVQDREYINGKPVFYSLGNLVFDQMWSEETKKGLLVKLIFSGTNILNIEEIKTYMSKIGQPNLHQVDSFQSN